MSKNNKYQTSRSLNSSKTPKRSHMTYLVSDLRLVSSRCRSSSTFCSSWSLRAARRLCSRSSSSSRSRRIFSAIFFLASYSDFWRCSSYEEIRARFYTKSYYSKRQWNLFIEWGKEWKWMHEWKDLHIDLLNEWEEWKWIHEWKDLHIDLLNEWETEWKWVHEWKDLHIELLNEWEKEWK